MGLPVTYFEITGKDGKKLQEFYSKTFDWKIDANNPMNYGTAETGPGGLTGGITASQDGSKGVYVYIQTDDIPGALQKVESAGGKTVMPQQEIPDFGIAFGMFSDPEGNVIGLWRQLAR
ncbi:MAG: VOC family protein [Chloroflexi bacterium]|nr:VOC family protein [Chloroflexota bacterium]